MLLDESFAGFTELAAECRRVVEPSQSLGRSADIRLGARCHGQVAGVVRLILGDLNGPGRNQDGVIRIAELRAATAVGYNNGLAHRHSLDYSKSEAFAAMEG